LLFNHLEKTNENRSMVVAQYLWTSFVIFGSVCGLKELDLKKIAFFFLGGARGAGGQGSLSIMDKSLDQNKCPHVSNMWHFLCGERPWMDQHPH